MSWLDRWDDGALLFLRHVERVSVLDTNGTVVRSLELKWTDRNTALYRIGDQDLSVRHRQARAADGRTWLVHSADAAAPLNVGRHNKATDATTPLGLALPLYPEQGGFVYAGLPIVRTTVPVRVNAQFDPVASRAGLASTAWNDALLPLIADLWVEVVQDLFAQRPDTAWTVMPLPGETGDAADAAVRVLEELLLDRSRAQLATNVKLTINGTAFGLTDLAVEEPPLSGVIELSEIAELARTAHALPGWARDPRGRWRQVLDDWRAAGADLPPPISVRDALILMRDSDRAPTATIHLAAAALDAHLADQLATLPCVITTAGDRLVPPGPHSLRVLLTTTSSLAEQIGIGIWLAAEHLAENASARKVLTWLRQIGAVLDDGSPEQVLRRLAAAGNAGSSFDAALTDDQLRALRDTFERLPVALRQELGNGAGKAIRIDAYSYDRKGQRVSCVARPVEVYLSGQIDREPMSFAAAAQHTAGLLWTNNRYAEQLRSTLGREVGLGPQKFLGLLGVERSPRLVPHTGLIRRYNDRRLGLPAGIGHSDRAAELHRQGATHTLDDLDSPDLRAVALSIAMERKAPVRRRRATALLAVLARAWTRLRDEAQVVTADEHYGWQVTGSTKAYWLWSVGAIAWLDDMTGKPRAPRALRMKTAATIAIHGPDAAGYARPESDLTRREILTAFGVAGEPSTRDLVARLRQLREGAPASDTLEIDAAIVYQALAERLGQHSRVTGDLTLNELRNAFAEEPGLVYTNLGWQRPVDVLAGPPVFHNRHAFAPQVANTERLWSRLQIREPTIDDCLDTINQLAKTRQPPEDDDVLMALETLRLLAKQVSTATALPHKTSRRLTTLALFTSQGWLKARPVYTTDDPALASGLGKEVPVWLPGGEIVQFEDLLSALRISRIDASSVTVTTPDAGRYDPDATELFAATATLFQQDLALNDPTAVQALACGWDRLHGVEIHVDPDLRASVEGIDRDQPIEVDISAKADIDSGRLYLRTAEHLRRVDGAGRAIAGLFTSINHRQLAQAWLAACVAAEEGQIGQRLELAEQQAVEERARNDKRIADQKAALGRYITDRQAQPKRPRTATSPRRQTPHPTVTGAPSSVPARELVDPSTLTITGTSRGQQPSARPNRRPSSTRWSNTTLPQPDRSVGSPVVRTPAPSFTATDKESVGLDLVRRVLNGDERDIADLRAQRGVGADAVDELERFYELKVHLGEEPDSISLQESQIRRALSTPDFFLVVVSNVEGRQARPQVRIIPDPVHQLSVSQTSLVTFSGVRTVEHSLVYDFGPLSPSEDRS